MTPSQPQGYAFRLVDPGGRAIWEALVSYSGKPQLPMAEADALEALVDCAYRALCEVGQLQPLSVVVTRLQRLSETPGAFEASIIAPADVAQALRDYIADLLVRQHGCQPYREDGSGA